MKNLIEPLEKILQLYGQTLYLLNDKIKQAELFAKKHMTFYNVNFDFAKCLAAAKINRGVIIIDITIRPMAVIWQRR